MLSLQKCLYSHWDLWFRDYEHPPFKYARHLSFYHCVNSAIRFLKILNDNFNGKDDIHFKFIHLRGNYVLGLSLRIYFGTDRVWFLFNSQSRNAKTSKQKSKRKSQFNSLVVRKIRRVQRQRWSLSGRQFNFKIEGIWGNFFTKVGMTMKNHWLFIFNNENLVPNLKVGLR